MRRKARTAKIGIDRRRRKLNHLDADRDMLHPQAWLNVNIAAKTFVITRRKEIFYNSFQNCALRQQLPLRSWVVANAMWWSSRFKSASP